MGCNPGEQSARVGHYYAGRNNAFWNLLYESGIVGEELTHNEDRRLIEFGVGPHRYREAPHARRRRTFSAKNLPKDAWCSHKSSNNSRRVSWHSTAKTFTKNLISAPARLDCRQGHIYGARVFVLPSSSAKNASAGGVKLRYFRQLARFLKEMESGAGRKSGSKTRPED